MIRAVFGVLGRFFARGSQSPAATRMARPESERTVRAPHPEFLVFGRGPYVHVRDGGIAERRTVAQAVDGSDRLRRPTASWCRGCTGWRPTPHRPPGGRPRCPRLGTGRSPASGRPRGPACCSVRRCRTGSRRSPTGPGRCPGTRRSGRRRTGCAGRRRRDVDEGPRGHRGAGPVRRRSPWFPRPGGDRRDWPARPGRGHADAIWAGVAPVAFPGRFEVHVRIADEPLGGLNQVSNAGSSSSGTPPADAVARVSAQAWRTNSATSVVSRASGRWP